MLKSAEARNDQPLTQFKVIKPTHQIDPTDLLQTVSYEIFLKVDKVTNSATNFNAVPALYAYTMGYFQVFFHFIPVHLFANKQDIPVQLVRFWVLGTHYGHNGTNTSFHIAYF